MKKVVIWGHKLHSHTHSYIHNSYYNAFKKMGYDTYWFDNWDDVSNFNFDNCIFLTEGQVDQSIPINKSSFYILHHCNTDKYSNCKFINLCNYVNDCRIGKSYNYQNSTVEKITYYSFYDEKNNALYQPWATDLFPEDISNNNICYYDRNITNVYYIGSIWSENYDLVSNFAKACQDNNKNFIPIRRASDEEGRKYIINSYISPDIRCQHHVNVGYIPCRVFKNISYGTIPATNSTYVRDFFDIQLPYSDNTYNIFDINEKFNRSDFYKPTIEFLINEVRENHTFINRVNTILKFI